MPLRKAFLVSFVRSGGTYLLAFISSIIISRLLLPAEIGIFSLAMAVTAILHALRDFGIGSYLIKERELTEDKLRTVFGTALLLGWSIAALIFFSSSAVAQFYSEPKIEDIMLVLSVNSLLIPFGQVTSTLLRREQEFVRLSWFSLISTIAGSCTSIGFAFLEFGPISLAYGSSASLLVSMLLLFAARPTHILMLPSLKEWRGVFAFGGKVSLTTTIVQLGMQAPELLMGRYLGFTAVGLYVRGIGIAKLIEQFFSGATSWVMGAELGNLHRSSQNLGSLVLKLTDYTLVICWPALIFLSLKSEAIIWLLYGEAWLAAAPLVLALSLARGIQLIISQASPVYEGTGAIDLLLRNEIIVQIVSLGLLFMGVQYGLLAVAWLRVPYGIIVVAVHLSVLRRYADIGIRRLFFAIWRSGAVALGFGGALAGLIALEPVGWKYSTLLLAGEAIIMGVIYLVLVVIIRHPIAAELLTTARTLLPKGWNPR